MNYINQQHISETHQALQARDRLVFTPWGTTLNGLKAIILRGFGAISLLVGLAVVGAGICDVLGIIHEEGSVSAAFIVGGIFALAGYSLTFYRSCLEFDLALGRWRQEQGVPPFSKVRAGALADWNYAQFDREQRTVQMEHSVSSFAVWVVKLRSEGDHLPPLPVTGFEFLCQDISRAEALELARQLAQKLNLPLREKNVAELPPLPSAAVAPLSRPSLATLPPPPSSRIGVETLPDGTTSITLAGSPRKSLPALLPVGFFGVFIWMADWMTEQSHQVFLSHVPAGSRASFSDSPSSMLFFSPLLIFAAIPFLLLLASHLPHRHIRITPEKITVSSSLFGRQFSQRSVPRNAVHSIDCQQSTVVLVSDRTDLKLGAGLTLPERQWLSQVLLIQLGLALQ